MARQVIPNRREHIALIYVALRGAISGATRAVISWLLENLNI